MSTSSPFQGVVKDYGPQLSMPADSTFTQVVNQDALVYWNGALNSGNGGVQEMGTANSALFAGICRQLCPVQPYGSSFSQPNSGNLGPNPGNTNVNVSRNVRFKAKVTVGDAIAPLKAVYVGTDAQTLTTTSAGTAIGFVSPDQPIIASAVAGQYFDCELRANYPLYALD